MCGESGERMNGVEKEMRWNSEFICSSVHLFAILCSEWIYCDFEISQQLIKVSIRVAHIIIIIIPKSHCLAHPTYISMFNYNYSLCLFFVFGSYLLFLLTFIKFQFVSSYCCKFYRRRHIVPMLWWVLYSTQYVQMTFPFLLAPPPPPPFILVCWQNGVLDQRYNRIRRVHKMWWQHPKCLVWDKT